MSAAPEHLLPDDGRELPPAEAARLAGLDEAQLRELMAYGLVGQGELRLDLRGALVLRQAVRLRDDFDLDLFSTGLIARFMERIDGLEAELRAAQAQLGEDRGCTEVSFTSITSVAVVRSG